MALDKLTKVQSVGISSFIQVVGVVTATGGFVGDGSGLTGITASSATGDFSIADKIVHTGDTNTAIRFPAADTVTVETAGSERFRVDGFGGVGIKNTSPNNTLTVGDTVQPSYAPSSAGNYIEIARTSGADAGLLINKNTGQWLVGIDNSDGANAPLRFEYGAAGSAHPGFGAGTLGMIVKHDGKIGIGTNNPDDKLTVRGSNGSGLRVGDGTANVLLGTGAGPVGRLYTISNHDLIFGTNDSERLRITSDGDVKIKSFGNASNASADALQIGKTDNNYGITILSATNAQGRIDFTDTEDTNDPQGKIAYYHDSNSLQFFTNGSASSNERLRITSDGKMGVGTASPNHRLTLHQSGTSTFDALNITSGLTNAVGLQFGIDSASNVFVWHTANGGIKFATNNVERARVTNNGITFNGDTAAANALDDYEEGTWTPQLLGGTSNPSLTYSAQSGGYEKIGSLVHLSFFMNVSVVNSQGSGYLELHGLPYAPVTSPLGASEVPALVLQTSPFADGKAANRFAFCRTVGGSTRMFVGYRDLTNGNAIIPTNAAANIATGYFIGHITYRAS